ncbi:MAG TPA: hypothetical protein VFA56_06155 [Gaiellaceae bacterium]|nr:hypothetical protein [Gaiellaceae bacterium]
MQPFPVLMASLGAALALAAAAASRFRRWWPAAPLVAAALAALLVAYVAMEDTYRRRGISRWDAYRSPGGALELLFFASLVLLAASAVALAYAGLARKARLFRFTALLASLAVAFVVVPTVLGFSLN